MTQSAIPDQKALLKECRQLIKLQEHDRAQNILSRALRSDSLDSGGVMQAGRMLERLPADKSIKVTILGQFTTSWLVPALRASALARGEVINIDDMSYDNVMQDLMTWDNRSDVVILLPWHQRLLTPGERSIDQRIEEELTFWQQAWQLIEQNSSSRIIQVGYDWIDSGGSGQFLAGENEGEISLVRKLNQRIRETLPRSSYFVDLEQVSGIMGRNDFYDARGYFWTKQPLSEPGSILLAKYLWAGIRATITGPKKLLVLDLDNTLWGGVVGEVGALGIELGDNPAGEAFRSFQQLVKQISSNGCLLAVCSKNNEADAREPFETNSDMVLSQTDFAAFKASWQPKSEAIRQISEELNLGLDSFVFFDDSPTEREEISYALPEVEVVDVPPDPSDYRKALLDGLWFESINITPEDKQRAQQYSHERERAETRSGFNNLDDYLVSLEMTADVRSLDKSDLDRVVQLIGKTNQFNLTSRRHSREEVLKLLTKPHSIGLSLRLTDKFGEYGLCSVILATAKVEKPENTLVIDSWLMSCRVIGRTVEQFLFNRLVAEAKRLGFTRMRGEFIPTKKNSLVENLYLDLGFESIEPAESINQWFEYQLDSISAAKTFVKNLADDD